MFSQFTQGGVLLLTFAVWGVSARADNIDIELNKQSHKLVTHVLQNGYKNVGVLRFQLQKGKGTPTYNAGPINANLATRLENVLITYLEPQDGVGIIRGASDVAAKAAPADRGYETNPKLREKLFTYDYPLAWGKNTAKADAFFTGLVRLSDDMKTATLLIQAFDKKTNKRETVLNVPVKTDRTILADAGQSFVIPLQIASRSIRKRHADGGSEKPMSEALDEEAVKDADRRDDRPAPGGGGNEYIDFDVLYNRQPQPLAADPNEGGEMRLPPARPGQEVVFRVNNKTPEDLAVVIMVNGKNTLERQESSPEQCRKWILPRGGKPYGIFGYYDENDNLFPFQIVDPGHALVQNENADKLGLIEVYVFLKGEPPQNTDEIEISRRSLSLRGLTPTQRGKVGKPTSLEQAQDQLARATGLKRKASAKPRGVGSRNVDVSGGVIVPNPDLVEKRELEQREFPNPVLVSTPIVIRYFGSPAPGSGRP